ncbi:MAG: dihydroorotate oxidase [Candidatus Gracilibacteria bacterium]|nr:dihydroorotate oxidase [Candidatus Gracilibacteria bacterium]
MNLETTIGGVKLENPVFNASGPDCTTLEELEGLQKSSSSAIMMKSCSIEPREGNPEPRYFELELGSINSMGLPNLGYKKYIEFSKTLKQNSKKPVIASVVGLHREDFPILVKTFQEDSIVDLIEVNLSCPNVAGKPQIAYDFEMSDKILSQINNLGNKPIGLKLPPYFDFVHTEQMAKIISKYNISFITCINSVGNTLFIDPEKEQVVIKPKGGFGGLGGDYVKPIALANVRKFYELLGDKVDIIGVGGIKTGIDVFEFILAGASAVQLGTIYSKEGKDCFERILKEFEEYASKKGYKSIEEIRGKLKVL